ncbi:hypothetical protein ID0983_03680 [Helicobacter pylori]
MKNCLILSKLAKNGVRIEDSFKDKIRNAIGNIADQKLKVALVGGFSDGKTTI